MGIEKCKPKTLNERVDMGDVVDLFEFPKGSWVSLRFIDTDPLSVANHWIDIVTKTGDKKRFPKMCLAWDSQEEEDYPDVTCPYCKAEMARSVTYYLNAIVRDIQEDEPANPSKLRESERESGCKEKGSKSWTPIRVIKLTATLVAKIQGLADLNIHKIKGEKKPCPVSDDTFGMDIAMKYDEKATNAANKYTLNTGDKTELSKEEKKYLHYDITNRKLLKQLGLESVEQAKVEVKRLLANSANNKSKDDDDDDDDYDMTSTKKSKRYDEDDEPRKKSKSKSKFDEDDDDDEPRKKSKSKSKFDEDDDDEPVKKKKSKFDEDDDDEPVKKKKSKFDEDDDDITF